MPDLICKVFQGESFPSHLKIVLALEVYPGFSTEVSNLGKVATLSSFRTLGTNRAGGGEGVKVPSISLKTFRVFQS